MVYMTVVKPPDLRDLIRTYGSPKAAVQHLIESGYTPEEIEWKLGVPYYLIQLFMRDFQPKNPVPFFNIVRIYDRLALLRGKKGKETELVRFFQRKKLSLEVKVRLALGKITDERLGIGEGIVKKAICIAAGASTQEVRELLTDYGEYGEVAYLLTKPKTAKLTTEEVYEAIKIIPKIDGIFKRTLHISSLLKVSTPDEAKYVVRLILGDLKLGYQENTVISAISRAFKVPVDLVEKASAILGLTEGLLLASKGKHALSGVKIRPGQFIKPQLAHLYEPDKVIFPARVELKYDGSRLQIHKWGTRVQLFSRRGIEKSSTLPEIVDAARNFKAHSCIIDCEVIAVDEEGGFLPFQFLLERTVPRELSEEELSERMRKIKLTLRAFDILHLNGIPLINRPLSERRRHLLRVVPTEYLAEGKDCEDEVALMRFYEEALLGGLEGVIVKALESPYEAGRRTYTWLKIKPERDTIDCTIVKALYGKGRRAGLYSSFLLAIRDPKKRRLFTIGKVSNLPEKVMESLSKRLEETKKGEDKEGIYVKPTIVVEVTYQEIQETDEYTSGYALRVPKIVRFRGDKTIEDIDDLEKLQSLYELQYDRYSAK